MASSQRNNVRQGLPGRRISGGSRSPSTACLTTPGQPVVALMPKSNLGLTLSERPTFWFSLPAISTDRTLEFGLYDQSGELIYQETFDVPNKAGISSLALPNTFAPLSAEKDYRWYLSVVCNPASRSEDLVVTGWIRRMQADSALRSQLADATLQERLSVYETSELWFETLTMLAELRRTVQADYHPTQLPADTSQQVDALRIDEKWRGLLESIDLTQVAAVPFSNESISK
ncbi:MAG: DUF928 domain-containing protein [Phormidesmis sp.]